MKWFTLTSAAFLLCSAAAQAQIYADFSTSMGDFTCELNYTAAPKTVANSSLQTRPAVASPAGGQPPDGIAAGCPGAVTKPL